jgi:hypothetical protein
MIIPLHCRGFLFQVFKNDRTSLFALIISVKVRFIYLHNYFSFLLLKTAASAAAAAAARFYHRLLSTMEGLNRYIIF